jgi:YgiT-type zinc finger domain-containing protein
MKEDAMLKITVCPSCGSDRIRKVRRDWTGTYNDEEYVVAKLAFHECPRCGEKVYDREAMRRIEARSPAFRNGTGGRSTTMRRKRARAC